MGSSKKHKKHKSERREKYEEYSNNMDPAQLQRGLKLILKVGSNSTPEYSGDSTLAGPPTAAEAMMAAAPSSPMAEDEPQPRHEDYHHTEKHKKSKKKKKKKDREKKHKHHKEKRHRSERHEYNMNSSSTCDGRQPVPPELMHDENRKEIHQTFVTGAASSAAAHRSPRYIAQPPPQHMEGDSSQDGFSFMDDNDSQPLPENILLYAGITTENSPSCRPVSKPIVPLKDDVLIDSPASSSMQSSSLGANIVGAISPTKPLPDLLIPSPSASTAASTPGGASSLAALTPKQLEAPKTPSSSSESGREPRTCVLKLKQQKSPLNKLLDHLLRFLEKRDPHQFFAWPVTDDIAPGYSSIITKPMDFSTIRQKIDDSEYVTLTEFTDDFKLMCENAIRYNHVDTVYHKAAKRLLQVGSKHLLPENLMRSLKPLSGYMRDLTAKELGFDLHGDFGNYDHHATVDSADEGASTGAEEQTPAQLEEEEKRRALRLQNQPKTRFEPYVDDLTSEEILAQVQGAARAAKKRLSAKEKAHKMGFLRQNKDGTTSLNLLIKDENEGPERVVSLGELVGKLQSGTGQLQGACEDKRNDAKVVKPLNYGAFASFAPSFDSRFSNLSREETQLVMRTYGDATSTEYAESILQFTKDSNYASMLANGLLDMLTNGEHSKAMSDLYDMQVQNHEHNEVFKCFSAAGGFGGLQLNVNIASETREQIEEEYEKYKNTRIDFTRLRTLKDLGIDVEFLDNIEAEMKNFELTRRLQEHLSNNLNLIEKLRATQHERLSQPLPQHLAYVPQAGAEELHLAHQITQQLSDVAKKLPPSAVVDPYSLRKAMGMSNVGLEPPPLQTANQRVHLPEVLQQPVTMPPQLQLTGQSSAINISDEDAATVSNVTMPMEIDDEELREILESGATDLHAVTSADETPWM
ncbi:bromodomain-containing protein 7 [Eurosta solidaginis]|uniref:bromodomain-containing protein 7 n=1 Tax=Eurosta solidaginis TaxID=178769 RepID=UPI0035308FD5